MLTSIHDARPLAHTRWLLGITVAGLTACGCARQHRGASQQQTAERVQGQATARAIELNRQGLAVQHDLPQAERLFTDACQADLFFGPAHNNLGIVYFEQGKYYQAAWQFQHAAKLMPKTSEPLVNLGLVFEQVGRLQDAEAEYDKALAICPDGLAAIQCMARLLVRTGRDRDRAASLLEQVALRSRDPNWQSWAQLWLFKYRGGGN